MAGELEQRDQQGELEGAMAAAGLVAPLLNSSSLLDAMSAEKMY